MSKDIPFVDLQAQYETIKPQLDLAIAEAIRSFHFVGGELVTRFENNFAQYLGVKSCISCANGTDAIEIVLKALGIGQGDEVIVPAVSWISTASAVCAVGASPVFVDILPNQCSIDPQSIIPKINSNTKAIIPVHIYGQPVDMASIMQIAGEYNLLVIEDCAQSHGADFQGKKVGSFGHAATFSFYPSKNLGAYGDAGGIVTNNDALAEKCRWMINHGQRVRHEHVLIGRNSKLDAIQAAILDTKLSYLDQWNLMRKANAAYYSERLKDLPMILPSKYEMENSVFHLFVIQVENRDFVFQKLIAEGIQCQLHYPKALPDLEPFTSDYGREAFPNARQLTAKCISLPMFPELSQLQMDRVVECLKQILL